MKRLIIIVTVVAGLVLVPAAAAATPRGAAVKAAACFRAHHWDVRFEDAGRSVKAQPRRRAVVRPFYWISFFRYAGTVTYAESKQGLTSAEWRVAKSCRD
jgi:hypothetical protein